MTDPTIHEVDSLKKSLNYDFVDLRIADKRVTTRLADTQQKRYVGLSNSDKIGKNEGMLFEYPQEKKHRLVMRDMNFPLDVVHVGGDGRVNKWGSMSESGEAVEGVSKYAIELPHGWCEKHGLEKGDPIHILDPPEDKQKLFKGRRYVDDPTDAPEDVEVQEGPQGGLYYEVDDGEGEDSSGEENEWQELPSDMSEEDWESVEGMEFEVGGETFTIDEYRENGAGASFVTTEERLTGDEPAYIGEVDAEGIGAIVIDEVREPTGETTGGVDEPDIDEDEWDEPPERLDELEEGQTVLIDNGRLQTATVNWASEDIVSTFLDDTGNPQDITDVDDIVGVAEGEQGERISPEEADSAVEMVDSIPFYGDAERLEGKVKDRIKNNVNNVRDDDTAKRILDHIEQFESMPGRAHVEFAAGKDTDRAAFNVGSSANRDTVNHEFGHIAIDAHGLGIGTFAAREAMQEYDSEEDNFIQLDPEDEDYHLTPTDDEAEPTPEIERLAEAVNQGWKRLQEGGEENSEKYNIGSNYSATNAHEFMAALNEELQKPRKSIPEGEVNWFDNHPEVLPAYLEVFEPSDENKAVISYLHENREDSSPFEENPYPNFYPENADKMWKNSIAQEIVEKARRYVDSPNDIPEEYEMQEGPKGGIYYETGDGEDEASPSVTTDDLNAMVEESNYVKTEGANTEWLGHTTTKETLVVDYGEGPTIVPSPMGWPGDDGEQMWMFEIDDEGDDPVVPESDVEVLGVVKPKRDEFGRLINPMTAEVEEPEPNESFNRTPLNKESFGDWHDDREVAGEVFEAVQDRIREAYTEKEVYGEVWSELEDWKMKGYKARTPIWAAAMAMQDEEVIPEHLTEYMNHGVDDVDPEVLSALCDLSRLSKETVREEFGDSFTVYRAIDGDTFRQYAQRNEDGSVTIKPQVLESWSHDRTGAKGWADHKFTDSHNGRDYAFVEKEFSPEDVGFYGPITLGKVNESYKEITMSPEDDTYTIPAEQIDDTFLQEKAADGLEEPPRMPSSASDWMFTPNPSNFKGGTKGKLLKGLKSVFKARRYVDHPDEVPEQYEVQEGPQGGLYYETGVDEEEEEEGAPSFDQMPNTQEVEPLSSEEIKEIDYGELIWTVDEDGNMVIAEVDHARNYDIDGLRGKVAIPIDGEPEDGFSIYPRGTVYGLASEEALTDDPEEEVDFDDLHEGQEIVFESTHGEVQVGTVYNTWEDSDRENITVIGEKGREHAVFPDDYRGLPEDRMGGVDISTDDLTGRTVEFDTGQRGYVIDGEGNGLQVELLSGPDAGETIYGVRRDSIDDVVDDEFNPDLEEGWAEVPDVGGADLDTAKEWIRPNTYVHQDLKVYDKATGEVRDGFVSEKSSASIEVQVKGVDADGFQYGARGDSNRFEIVGAQEFESLDEDGKLDTLVKTFQEENKFNIDRKTRQKVKDNFFGDGYSASGSLINAKDWQTSKHVAESMSFLKNEVDRASCGGSPGDGYYHISVSKNESDDTIAHELGHGIATSFGYDYKQKNQNADYGPRDLSHNYTEYSDTQNWSGFIDWDLSDDSSFYDPEEYMFSTWDEMGDIEDVAVGFESFKDEVEEEVDQRYREEEVVMESWESADYEEPDEDAVARQVFESLNEGDLVQLSVPDWDAGRDEDNNPLDTEMDYAKFSHISEGDRDVAVFERNDGSEWKWPLQDNGELNSQWSSVEGVATNPETPEEDEDSDNTGSGGIPASETAETFTEHLSSRWDGFNNEAEKPEEKAANLMRAVNRAWYKQAKVHEASGDPTDRQKVVMETGYSATNAHETMAQLHEVMQTPTESNKQRANDIFDEHPYLMLAYLDIWEPSPEMMEEMQELLQALGIEL